MNIENINGAKPARIVSFDPATQTATVQISVTKIYSSANDLGTQIPYGLLEDVPVHVASGGGHALTMPIAPGDTCLLLFSDFGYDHWLWEDKDEPGEFVGQAPPWTGRKRSLKDPLCLVGFNTLPRAITGYAADATELRNLDGDQAVSLKDNGDVDIVGPASGSMEFATNMTLDTPATQWTGDLALAGGATINGGLDMLGSSLSGLAAPTNPTDAVTKAYADALEIGGGGPGPGAHVQSFEGRTGDVLAEIGDYSLFYAPIATAAVAATAFGWGDHAAESYLKEVDLSRANWDLAFTWGDHSVESYLKEADLSRANWNAAFSWGDHSIAGYLLEVDIDRTNWDLAFGWGDHSLAGYLIEADLSRANWDAAFGWGDHAGLYATVVQGTNADTALSWGDHSLAGYLIEADLSRANWDAAFAWGDHATELYLKEADLSRADWDAAFGWGDHSTEAYLKEVDLSRANWDAAFGWGDHSTRSYLRDVATIFVTNAIVSDGGFYSDRFETQDKFIHNGTYNSFASALEVVNGWSKLGGGATTSTNEDGVSISTEAGLGFNHFKGAVQGAGSAGSIYQDGSVSEAKMEFRLESGFGGGSFFSPVVLAFTPLTLEEERVTIDGVAKITAGATVQNTENLSSPYQVVTDNAGINFVTNPVFGNATYNDGWSVVTTGVMAENNTDQFLGDACLKITMDAIGSGAKCRIDIPSPKVGILMVSAWVRGEVGGEDFQYKCTPEVSGGTESGNYTFVGRNLSRASTTWRRYSMGVAVTASDTYIDFSILGNKAVTCALFVDGVQAEYYDGSSDQLPETGYKESTFICGDMGEGYAWTGTPHDSTSTREAGTHYISSAIAADEERLSSLAVNRDGSVAGGTVFKDDRGAFGSWTIEEYRFSYSFIGDITTDVLETGADAATLLIKNGQGVSAWIESGTVSDAGAVFSFPSLVDGAGIAVYAPDDLESMRLGDGKFFTFADKNVGSSYSWFVDRVEYGNSYFSFDKKHVQFGGGSYDSAATPVAMTGTCARAGGVVTGTGTLFTEEFEVGDKLIVYDGGAEKDGGIVSSITSDTSMTTTNSIQGWVTPERDVYRGAKQYSPGIIMLEGDRAPHGGDTADSFYSMFFAEQEGQLKVRKSNASYTDGVDSAIEMPTDSTDGYVIRQVKEIIPGFTVSLSSAWQDKWFDLELPFSRDNYDGMEYLMSFKAHGDTAVSGDIVQFYPMFNTNAVIGPKSPQGINILTLGPEFLWYGQVHITYLAGEWHFNTTGDIRKQQSGGNPRTCTGYGVATAVHGGQAIGIRLRSQVATLNYTIQSMKLERIA